MAGEESVERRCKSPILLPFLCFFSLSLLCFLCFCFSKLQTAEKERELGSLFGCGTWKWKKEWIKNSHEENLDTRFWTHLLHSLSAPPTCIVYVPVPDVSLSPHPSLPCLGHSHSIISFSSSSPLGRNWVGLNRPREMDVTHMVWDETYGDLDLCAFLILFIGNFFFPFSLINFFESWINISTTTKSAQLQRWRKQPRIVHFLFFSNGIVVPMSPSWMHQIVGHWKVYVLTICEKWKPFN